MTSERHRRNLMNPKVNRRARLRLLMPFGVMVGAIGLIGYSMNQTISALGEQFTKFFSEKPSESAVIAQLLEKVKVVVTVDVGFIAVLALLLWAYYSFRIFGPQVAIERHVQNLIKGDFESRIRLRKYDEFAGLADQLNRLAEVMKERSPK